MIRKRSFQFSLGLRQQSFLVVGALTSLLFFASSSVCRADILIDNFSDATNNRFTNSSSFIANGLDLSGVARATNGRWGTLISRNAVLTARHAQPTLGSSFFFYESNDPNGTRHEAIVVGGQAVGGTDLYISILDRNVDPAIKVYNFATEDLHTDPNAGNSIDFAPAGPWQGLNAYMVGISPTSGTDRTIDIAVGRNRITSYEEDVPFLSYTDSDNLILEYNSSTDSDYVTHEAFVQGGDSGAPMFVELGGELVLLGINSFQINLNPDLDFIGSGISYTGNVNETITTILNANAVPELSSAVVVGLMLVAYGARRRQRHQTTRI